jgi:hypothetical protein
MSTNQSIQNISEEIKLDIIYSQIHKCNKNIIDITINIYYVTKQRISIY